MSAKRQAHVAVILHDFTARGHRAEHDVWFIDLRQSLVLTRCGGCEEGKGFISQRFDRPKRFTPDKT